MRLAAALVLLLLAAGPACAADPGTSAAAFDRSRLDETITIDLKEAQLQAVLDLVAKVLHVTPVIDPAAVDRKTVTLSLQTAPVRAVISRLESEFFLTIRFEGDRMLVREPLRPVKKSAEDEASEDARLLADRSIPRRPQGSWPPTRPRQFELRLSEPGRVPSVFHLEEGLATFTLPGCSAPLTVSVFGPDAWDLEPRIAFVQKPPDLARIGSPSKPAHVAGCPAEVEFRQLETPVPSPQEPEIRPSAGNLILTAGYYEVRPEGEVRLGVGHYAIPGGQSFSSSMHFGMVPGGATVPRTSFYYTGTVLALDQDSATVAFIATATRDLDSSDGSGRVTLLLGRTEQTMKLHLGRKERVTLSSTYRGGNSALVVDVEVERSPKR